MDIVYNRTNHVISVKTNGRKPLVEIFKTLRCGIYRPKKFSALTFKVSNPKTTLIFFSTGNLTLMGSPSYYGALYVLQYIKVKLGLELINVRLTNIVSKFSICNVFEKTLSIQRFFLQNSDKSISKMIIFPCCSYMIPNSRIKVNIFKTGSMVVAGCADQAALESSINYILEEIQKFIDNDKSV